MKENKTMKTIAIAVISILIIVIISLGIYTVLIKKDDNQGGNNNQNNTQENYVFTKLEKNELDSDRNFTKYVTNHFTMIPSVLGQCGEVFSEAIDIKGNSIKVNMNNYEIYNLQIDNGKLIAIGDPNCSCNSDYEECKPETKVELVYDGKTIEIKEVK